MGAIDGCASFALLGCCAAAAVLAGVEALLWVVAAPSARSEGEQLVRALRALAPGGSIRLEVEGREVEISVPYKGAKK